MSEAEIIELSTKLNRLLAKDTLPPAPKGPPRLHQSIAKVLVTESPLHAWRAHRELGDIARVPTTAMEFGTVVHKLVLGKGHAFHVIDGFENFKKNDAKKARDEARKARLVPILRRDFERAETVAGIALEKLAQRGIALCGQSEMPIEWSETTSSGHEVLCAGTLDHFILQDRWGDIYDLKTSESANPEHIERQMYNTGADIQWAAYTSAVDKARALQGRVRMHFIYAETFEPFCMTIARPDGSMRSLGQQRWERAIDLWHECLMRDSWPEYATGVVDISAPSWALKKELEHE